ncbi:MAG: hypothetical protein GY927_22940 [bacterium]|nr:hypothetical protein [bacterium]
MIDQTLPESKARKEIDRMLIAAGWVIQDKNQLNCLESLFIAVRDKIAGLPFWTAHSHPQGQHGGGL